MHAGEQRAERRTVERQASLKPLGGICSLWLLENLGKNGPEEGVERGAIDGVESGPIRPPWLCTAVELSLLTEASRSSGVQDPRQLIRLGGLHHHHMGVVRRDQGAAEERAVDHTQDGRGALGRVGRQRLRRAVQVPQASGSQSCPQLVCSSLH